MEERRKLELLVKYDFSDWRYWVEGKRVKEYWGLVGSGLAGIFYLLSAIDREDQIGAIKKFKGLEESYSVMISKYSEIDFSELDLEDPDFKFLFDYSEKLIDLGKEINHLEQNILEGRDASINKSLEIAKELRDMNYRDQVLDKYGLKYSWPDDVNISLNN
jgi:uncharacterized protein YdcH (DUF465 family)